MQTDEISKMMFKMPDGVDVGLDRRLRATKAFCKGDNIYSTYGYKIGVPHDLSEHTTFTLNFGRTSHAVTLFSHTRKTSGGDRILYTFDGFMNHSKDATTMTINCVTLSNGDVHYDRVAVKDIFPGEELTCDYCYLG